MSDGLSPAALVDAFASPALVTTAEGSLRYWNDEFRGVTGSADADLGDMTVAEAFPEDQRECIRTAFNQVVEDGGGRTLDTELSGPDTDRARYEVTLSAIDGEAGLAGVLVVGRDVTERDRYELFVEKSADIISVVDDTGTIRYHSPAVERVLGYDQEEQVGESGFDYAHPDDRGQLAELLSKFIQGESEQERIKYRYRHADGSWRWMEMTAHQHLDEPGVQGILLNSRDVTDSVRHERQLREEREKYSTLVESLNEGVIIAQNGETVFANQAVPELLETSLDAVQGSSIGDYAVPEDKERIRERYARRMAGEDVPERYEVQIETETGKRKTLSVSASRITYEGKPADMAVIRDITDRKERERQLQVLNRVLRHNVRNAVNSISGRAEHLATEVKDELASELDQIERRADRLLSTAEKGRTLNEQLLEGSGQQLEHDLTELVDQVTLEYRSRYPDADISVAADPVTVRAVAPVYRVIAELVENAIVHNDADSPSVTISVESGDDVVLRVADNGPGLPEAESNVLTGTEEVTPLYHGKGFGLYLVRWLIRESGGRVSVDVDDEGTTVVVELPAA
jgi:PAS domain S-box-containing protein